MTHPSNRSPRRGAAFKVWLLGSSLRLFLLACSLRQGAPLGSAQNNRSTAIGYPPADVGYRPNTHVPSPCPPCGAPMWASVKEPFWRKRGGGSSLLQRLKAPLCSPSFLPSPLASRIESGARTSLKNHPESDCALDPVEPVCSAPPRGARWSTQATQHLAHVISVGEPRPLAKLTDQLLKLQVSTPPVHVPR